MGPIDNFNFLFVLPILLSLFFGVMLTGIIYGIVGLMSFWIEDSMPFTWIVQKFQMILGLFFPPEFFSNWIQCFITYSPIYAMMSGPCKLLANFSWTLFLGVIVSQILWLIVFILLGLWLCKIGVKKVNVHGG